MAYGLQSVILLRQMLESSDAHERHKRIERSKLDAMLGLCEIADCRRQSLLRYFGEAAPEPCGNCDNCLEPPQTREATVAAQKALSAVLRTGQRFGVGYLVDVLLGKESERIARFGHDRLQVYGLGAELDAAGWSTLFRQLVSLGLISVDVEGHGSLRLTEAARPVLRGERTLELRRDRKPQKKPRSKRQRQETRLDPADRPLWEALRAKRRELAEQQGVPPYVIFHDSTLLQMVQHRPGSLERMLQLEGVGEIKLERYGREFPEVLQAAD